MQTSLKVIANWVKPDAEARLVEEPGAEKLHAGVCEGKRSNPLSYLDSEKCRRERTSCALIKTI